MSPPINPEDHDIITYRGEYVFLTLTVLPMIWLCIYGIVQVWFVVLTTLLTEMCILFWKSELKNH